MAISLEPPPTSITATMPSGASSSVRVAPTNDSRASSSPDRTLSSTPPAFSTASTKSPRLRAVRMAAVATATMCSAPTSRATDVWVRTTSAVSAIFCGGIMPPSWRLFPMRVNARCATSSRSRPSPASATSSRVVLLPMSMQAQIKQSGAPPLGARRPRTP